MSKFIMRVRRKFRDLREEHSDALECLTCPPIGSSLVTQEHRSADFDESMVWFVCTLKVFALGYARTNALRSTAKVQRIVKFSVLDVTIQTEQPRATDVALA
jgi:hypothetical protein